MTTSSANAFQYLQPTFKLDDLSGMVKAIEEDGYALIPNVLNQEEIQTLKTAIDRLQPAHPWDRHNTGRCDHYKNVFNQDITFLPYIDRPGVYELANAVMGPECHIIGETAWRSYPGHDGRGIHADQIFFPLPADVLARPDVKQPVFISTAHYYLSDITIDLCPTHVIPKSHKSGTFPAGRDVKEWNGNQIQPVLCKAGDVLFFRSEVWHSGGLNSTTDKVRYLLQVHYSKRNVSQHFMPFLTFQHHPQVLATATKRQRLVLGEHSQAAYD